MSDPKLSIKFKVIAYDCAGYGDDRSKDFSNATDAIAYAKGLENRFNPAVVRYVTMAPITTTIWDSVTDKESSHE